MNKYLPLSFALLFGANNIAVADVAVIETSMGTIECTLFADKAPITVDNFESLAQGTKEHMDNATGKPIKSKFYDGLTFHRVIPGSVIQGGDPNGDGSGGPGYTFINENKEASFAQKGALAMANAGPDTNGSQFFITVEDNLNLQGADYTIFGQVIKGQDVADAISNVPTGEADKPIEPVVIKSITIKK